MPATEIISLLTLLLAPVAAFVMARSAYRGEYPPLLVGAIAGALAFITVTDLGIWLVGLVSQ